MNKTVLVDAKNLLYRAHFGFQGLETTEGSPTSVLHGFPSMLLDVLKVAPRANLVIVWEGDMLHKDGVRQPTKPLWRKVLAPYYKANRVPNPKMEQATDQLPSLFRMLDLMGWPQVCIPQLEADDVIGVLASYLAKLEGPSTYIYSSDHDFFQLVGKRTYQLKPSKEGATLVLKDDVLQTEGVLPKNYVRYKALAGDNSDNIKPLPGVGPKTALKYLADGLDASLPDWSYLPKEVRKKYPKLKDAWPLVHEAYILSYIPRRADYPYLPEVCTARLQSACETIATHPSRRIPTSEVKARQADFRKLCLEFELSSLAALGPQLIYKDTQ